MMFHSGDLNYETIQGYRNRHQVLNAGHPFERLNNDEYLRSIGAAAYFKRRSSITSYSSRNADVWR